MPESLIQKYNIPVPRYTSYPPANFFHENFGPEDYIKAIEASNMDWPENISIYIHIPFCSKMCHFCGCNTHFTRDGEKMKRYAEAVKKEIGMVKKLLDPSRKVSQIHWGGGTPNALPVELIREIMEVIHKNFSFIEKPEIAIECHPAMLDENYTAQLILAGFNRFSLGIQDFKQEVLDNVNRDAPKVPVEEIMRWIRSFENVGVNLDFIYGLPFQNEKTFTETIEKAVELSPDRLVTFSYAHVPWIKKAQKILEFRGLPEANEKLAMFLAGYKILIENGYAPIGLDHYAKDTDELSIALKNRKLHRNFQGYCTRETTGQVYAFGATGISQLESVYAQNGKDTNTYVEMINKEQFTVEKGYYLNMQEKIIRHVINEIMCNEYVSLNETAEKFCISKDEIKTVLHFDKKLFDGFVSDKLLKIDQEENLKITDTGRFFIRNIAAQFDPNLQKETKRFSKAL
ncbi:MAG TPA: oxygen-independent coproporphyrinogen III oxidase [Mariniphaga anaerophila]|uniref:Coproporphyrinogen-III oxidase n=1 Tax=Mariniphaga anaerophila TaxID=1484053 RepID=A0A831LRN1_9BACT|nr:oxygen-independent coproporphyrinogen III oxidase [Mariniphaga anaerophila]